MNSDNLFAPRRRLGIWIAGAYGDIASTLIAGTLAINAGCVSRTGLVTDLLPMRNLPLAHLDDIVFGGVDIKDGTMFNAVERVYHNSRTLTRETLDVLREPLTAIDANISTDSGTKGVNLDPPIAPKAPDAANMVAARP